MISFKVLTKEDDSIFEIMEKWDNDEAIKHLLRPNFSDGPLPDMTSEQLKKGLLENDNKFGYVAFVNDKPVGYVTIDLAFPMLMKKDEKTAWISICIGDCRTRGRGVGQEAMRFLEKTAKSLGCTRIELGVFSFNEVAKRFYVRNGYEEFARINDFIYYQGKRYADIRMEKTL